MTKGYQPQFCNFLLAGRIVKGEISENNSGLVDCHRKAVIVAVTDEGEETKLIISKVEKQPGRPGGIRSKTPYESQLVRADDSRQRELTGHLNIYYDAVIACIRDAESLLSGENLSKIA